MRLRRMVAPIVVAALAAGCGGRTVVGPNAQKAFLDSVYTQAPGISTYRSGAQLVSLGQAICGDLGSGASVEELGDRLPLVEGDVTLPPADLGVVISAAIGAMCPRFQKLLDQ